MISSRILDCLIKLFCVFTKTIDQFKLSIIHQVHLVYFLYVAIFLKCWMYQMFDIYDKLFDHINRTRAKLTRKKIAWKRTLLQKLIVANTKLRYYYFKTQESLDQLYEKTTLLTFNRKNTIFQKKNWKNLIDDMSWADVYWNVLFEQFIEKYRKDDVSRFVFQNINRIDNLNVFFDANVSTSFDETNDETNYYRNRDL
jgi:hypothetical protein